MSTSHVSYFNLCLLAMCHVGLYLMFIYIYLSFFTIIIKNKLIKYQKYWYEFRTDLTFCEVGLFIWWNSQFKIFFLFIKSCSILLVWTFCKISIFNWSGEVYLIQHYTIMALGRDEYPKLSTPLGLFPSG